MAAGPSVSQPPADRPRTRPKIYYGHWLVVAALTAQFASVGSSNYVPAVFLKPMTQDLGWTRADFTVARTLGQFVMAFAGLFIGAQVDRHGGRRLMLIGTTILVVALAAHARINALWQWTVLDGVVLAVGAALTSNLVVNVTLARWFVDRRGRALSLASMGVSLAGIIYPPATTYAVDTIGWRATWVVLAVVAAGILYPTSMAMRRAPEDFGLHPDGRSNAEIAEGAGQSATTEFATSLTRGQALRTPAFYLLVFAFGLGGLAIGVPLLQGIPFMTDAGYSRQVASYMIVLTSIPSALTKPMWGYYADRAAPQKLAAIGFLLNGIAIGAIVVTVHAHATYLVYASWLLLGFGWGGMIPLQEIVWAAYFGRRYLGAVRSAGLPMALILQAGGPLAASFYFDAVGDYNGALLAVAVLGVMAAGMVLLPRNPRTAIARREAAAGA